MQELRLGFQAKAVAFWLLNGLSAFGLSLCAHVLVQSLKSLVGCRAVAFPPERVVVVLWWVYSFLLAEHPRDFLQKGVLSVTQLTIYENDFHQGASVKSVMCFVGTWYILI